MFEQPPAELARQLERFLRRWAWIDAANMEAFAAASAAWLRLEGRPRLAAPALERQGLLLQADHLPRGLPAVWTRECDLYRIRFSPHLSAGVVNFTLWHEWFEILASQPHFPSRHDPHRLERLADRFAVCITMPREEIRHEAAGFRNCAEKIDVLAVRFGVSRCAMRHRLRELGLVLPGHAGAPSRRRW
jgi:hypothetical protein